MSKNVQKCEKCNGTGIYKPPRDETSNEEQMRGGTCPYCNGKGKVDEDGQPI